MKILRPLAIAVSVAALALLVLLLLAGPADSAAFYSPAARGTLLIAHMGGDGVWPGDTRHAYDQAYALGVDAFDMDVHLTKDGVIVLMHDESVARTTGGTGLVEDLAFSELEGLDAAYNWSPDGGKTFPWRGKGIRVTRLEELFQAYPDMRFLIEIKLSRNSIAEPLAALIGKYHLEKRVVVASFHDKAMAAFRAAAPSVATSASKGEVTAFVLLSKIGLSGLLTPRYQSLQVPYEPKESLGIEIVTPAFIRAAHAKNLRVEIWTPNDEASLRKYVAMGVDGIDTDRPDLLKAILSGK